jgi:hypothetical protein
MKTLKPISLALLVLAAAWTGVNGQTARTNFNPATLYYQAFLATPTLDAADRDYLFNTDWRGQKLPERFGELLARYDDQFKLVRHAARAAVPCDWGIDMSEGPATMLPHLARAKAVAGTTRLRVLWALQQGRESDARDDLLAAFTLARYVSRDGTLISGLVQMAMEAIVCNTVVENFGRFSPETLRQLADGLDAAPARGTVAACIPSEKFLFQDRTLRKVAELQKQNPGNDAKVMEGLRQYFQFSEDSDQGVTNVWERLVQASGGTSEGMVRLLQERAQLYQRITGPLALPYPECERQMKGFQEEMGRSPNPFVSDTLPNFWKARTKELRMQAYLAMVRAAIEFKLHGKPGLESVSDPCGQGPFAYRRFVFEGVDRGFELKSAYDMNGNKAVYIFVEKEGTPFRVDGPHVGEALPRASVPQ